MKAVVMAGGEGSRLRPLTLAHPKPLLPVVNRTVLGHILYLLKQHGITDVVLALQHLAAQIQDHVGDGKVWGLNVEYVIEEAPLGTAGSVKNAEPLLLGDELFLVISGDALTDFDLTSLIRFHRERKADLTMALYRVPDPLEYGVINIREDGRVAQFLEKPSWSEVTSDTVNTGIYVVDPEALARIPAEQQVDWSQDVFPGMLADGAGLFGYVAEGYWCDIGTISEYHRANSDLLSGRLYLGDLGARIGPGVWVGGETDIAPDAQLIGPIYLGEGVKVKQGAIIHGPAVVREYTIVDNRAQINRSIIWRDCYIGENVAVHGTVVGQQCSFKSRAVAFEGAVIADRTVVGQDAVIQPNVKIWPNKEVENGAVVSHSIIWGSQGRRVLFGRYGVTGIVNVDLTPDFVARLGAAFGSVLPRGSTVIINRDPDRSSRMIKRALISGLPSASNNVLDIQQLPIPVARYYTRAIGAAGGVHVRLSPYDQRVVDIRLLGPDGLNLTHEQERQIERVYFREEYRRAYLDEIGNIDYAADAVAVYEKGYLAALDVEAIRNAGLNIVVDYAHAPAAEVLPNLLSKIKVDALPLNAHVDASRVSITQDDFRAGRAQLARITQALDHVSLGARLDVGGEKLFVADDHGQTVPDPVMAVAMAALVFRSCPGSTIAVTVDQALVFERLAAQYGSHVLRCAVDPQALMLAAASNNVTMACDGTGNFAFPAFHPAVDGMFALGKLLALLAQQGMRLSEVIAELPPLHVATGRVEGNWETKGHIMRCLIQQFAKLRHETIDGIKIYPSEGAWVLIRPDSDTAAFHLVAEAHSPQSAQELIADYGGIVHGYVLNPCVDAAQQAN